MNLDNPIRMVRELKGAPLSILFALTIVKNRVSQAWLERSTGYTDKTIAQALGYLKEINLVDQTGAGWQLTGQAKQLPLPLEIEGSKDQRGEAENPEINQIKEKELDGGRRISDPVIIINTDSDFEENFNNNKGEGRKNSDSEVREALKRAKIVGKKVESLVKCAWMTADYVERWEAELKFQKKADYRPGLLVTYLESGAEAPPKLELDEHGQPKKDYLSDLIRMGLYCEICRQPVQECECEVENDLSAG